MPKLIELVNATEIASYLAENASNRIPYLGASLFPPKKRLGLKIKWIVGANGLPITLKASPFDANVSYRDRISVKSIETSMPFFKEAILISEEDRQQLNMLMASGQSDYVDMILKNVFDDLGGLVKGADVIPERMIMELLSTGVISIASNGQMHNYDYQHSAEMKDSLLLTARWSDTTNSTPVADITRWQDKTRTADGEKSGRAVCTSKTWNYLKENKSIRDDLNATSNNGGSIIITDNIMANYFENKCGMKIAVYDKMFINDEGNSQKFFKDDVFTLIPAGTLGETNYGTTPEESDLLSGNSENCAIVNTGVAITTTQKRDPVNVETKVSEIVLPSCPKMGAVFIATVHQ